MAFTMLFRRGAVWTFRKVLPKECRSILGRTAFVVSLKTTDLETAKLRLPAEALKATRAIEAARLTLQRGPAATVERVASRLIADYRKASPFGPERRGEPGELTEADVFADELERLEALAPTLEVKAKIIAIRALLNGDGSGKGESPLLSVIFEQWRAERRPTPKTWLEFSRALNGFTEVLGDLPVKAIRRDHIRTWKASLMTAQSKRGKNGGTIKVATAQKLLNTLRAVLEWAVREGFIETNPAHGVSRIAALDAKGATAEDRRMPFSVEQVRAIFAKLPEADARIQWLVKLAFYTGCRLSELTGLRPEDVRQEAEVRYLNIAPHAGRGLKTRSSIRKMPLAPAVADFTSAMLPFKPSSGHYWSKRINLWLRTVAGIRDPRLTLHSARHSFKDACRRAGLSEEVHDALTGHVNGGGVGRRYGLGVPLEVLAREIAKVSYPG